MNKIKMLYLTIICIVVVFLFLANIRKKKKNQFISQNCDAIIEYEKNKQNKTIYIRKNEKYFEDENVKISLNTKTNSFYIENKSSTDDIILISAEILISYDGKIERIFQNGYQSWSPSYSTDSHHKQIYNFFIPFFSYYIDKGTNLHHNKCSKFWNYNNVFISNMFTIIKNNKNSFCLYGFKDFDVSCGEFILLDEKYLIGYLDYKKIIKSNDFLQTSDILEIQGNNENKLLDIFSDIVYQNKQLKNVPTGWCSWYEFQTNINEEKIFSAIKEVIKSNLPFKYIQIDDGYSKNIGDWLTCDGIKFPNCMSDIMNLIKNKKLQGGIWVAPFLVGGNSSIFKENQNWILKNEKGENILATYNNSWMDLNSFTYSLDLSHPDVKNYIFDIFSTLKNMGFTYFKLDFLAAGHLQGNFFDKTLSRTEVYRNGLKIIRQAVGDECYILGCGAPISASIGLVDSMRISPDVNSVWEPSFFYSLCVKGVGIPSVKYQLKNVLSRQFMHNKWWVNDPDVVIVGEHFSSLSHNEFQFQISVIGILGGSFFISDDIEKISDDKMEILRKFLPISSLSGESLNILNDEFCKCLKMFGIDDKYLLCFINHERKNKYDDFQDENFHLYDFWNNILIDDYFITLGKNCCKMILFSKIKEVPQILGTTLNPFALLDGRIKENYDYSNMNLLIIGNNLCAKQGFILVKLFNKKSPLITSQNCEIVNLELYKKTELYDFYSLQIRISNDNWFIEIK